MSNVVNERRRAMGLKSRLLVTSLSASVIGLMSIATSTELEAAPRDHHKKPSKVQKHFKHTPKAVIHRGHPARTVLPSRARHFRNVTIIRPHGHWYNGYGWHKTDTDAFKWLAFTAITLKILDNLNEEQQREHEAAQIKATTMKVGETISWNKKNASGSVTVQRDGTSTTGRYCREFQQKITIGGSTEQAYGTACRNHDGSWEVVSTESP